PPDPARRHHLQVSGQVRLRAAGGDGRDGNAPASHALSQSRQSVAPGNERAGDRDALRSAECAARPAALDYRAARPRLRHRRRPRQQGGAAAGDAWRSRRSSRDRDGGREARRTRRRRRCAESGAGDDGVADADHRGTARDAERVRRGGRRVAESRRTDDAGKRWQCPGEIADDVVAQFFIARPVFAIVTALVILLAGGIAGLQLPIAQYPRIALPTNGVDGMLYMESTSSSAGTYRLSVTFGLDRDPDTASVQLQNRVAQATSSLPADAV